VKVGRQALLTAPRQLALRTQAVPRPGPGEVLLAVRCALSCGTDLKFFRRGHPLFSFPSPLGHEFAGVVAAVGAGVDRFKPGDELMAAPSAPCGQCFFCQREQANLCPQAMAVMVMGAYADFVLLPAPVVQRNAFLKPAALPFEEAALLEPLSCVVHAQALAQPRAAEVAAVVGAGPFGLLHALMLKYLGVAQVIVIGRGDTRLRWASEFGADLVLDARGADVGAALAALNRGYGPDLIIEATGQPQGWEAAMSWVRRGGRVVFFGGCPSDSMVRLDTRRMHYDNLTLLAPFHYRPADVGRARELLVEGTLGAARIITRRRRLSELAQVFEELEAGEVLKCAIVP